MLVLTRKRGEKIFIGENIVITVNEIGPGRVKLGIEAPPHIRIQREEIAGVITEKVGPRLAGSRNGMPGLDARQRVA